jgi:hypothetical protein
MPKQRPGFILKSWLLSNKIDSAYQDAAVLDDF